MDKRFVTYDYRLMTTMRTFRGFIIDITRKPPVLFPLVALFHMLWLVWTIVTMKGVPFGIDWLRLAWMLAYTFFWIGASDMRKWAALAYMGLTMLNFILFFSLKSIYDKDVYSSSLFLIDGLFSFFLLVYYKRFR